MHTLFEIPELTRLDRRHWQTEFPEHPFQTPPPSRQRKTGSSRARTVTCPPKAASPAHSIPRRDLSDAIVPVQRLWFARTIRLVPPRICPAGSLASPRRAGATPHE